MSSDQNVFFFCVGFYKQCTADNSRETTSGYFVTFLNDNQEANVNETIQNKSANLLQAHNALVGCFSVFDLFFIDYFMKMILYN